MTYTEPGIMLVGDRFVGFSGHSEVFTVSQFLRGIEDGLYAGPGDPVAVHGGQGVSDAEWGLIRSQLERYGLSGRMKVCTTPSVIASRGEVHKWQEPNTLIADLHQVHEGAFRATLRLHNDNELLLDHQTGQHVQGMVAIEAARQMFLAVTEQFYASKHPGRSYYFVIEAMNTAFENFLFPTSATIDYQVTASNVDDPTRLSFSATVGIEQAGRRSTLTELSFTAFESAVIEAKEDRRARKALDHAFRSQDSELINA